MIEVCLAVRQNRANNKAKPTPIYPKSSFLSLAIQDLAQLNTLHLNVSILTDFVPLSYWILTYILFGSKRSDGKSQGFETGGGRNVLVWH